jgi:hypothetical protein
MNMKLIALALLFASTSAFAQVVDEHPTCWGNETMTIAGETWCRVQPAAACTNCAKAYILDMSHGAPIAHAVEMEALPGSIPETVIAKPWYGTPVPASPYSPYIPYGGGRSSCIENCDRPPAESHD